MPSSVLVVEDDPDLAKLLELHLVDHGCRVSWERDGLQGLNRARARSHELIILDLMLPGLDGLELCKKLRQERDNTPILMLTAKSSELDRVMGLELGADDYLTKPFSVLELVARIKALFRRMEAMSEPAPPVRLRYDALDIDVAKRRVQVRERPVALTAKEFDLLVQFASNPGRVYTRSQLLDLVWGYGHDSYQHTVNSHINRLRAKIEEDASEPHYVQTVWGVGYKFFDPYE